MPGGFIYMTFKHGTADGPDPSGRWFANLTPDELRAFIEAEPGLVMVEQWTEPDAKRRDTIWVGAIAQRTGGAAQG